MNLIASALAAALLLQLLPIAGRSTIRGRVLDADGHPMPDVVLSALLIIDERNMVSGTAVSDAEGAFSIDKVPSGRILLRAQPKPRPRVPGQPPSTAPEHPPAYFPGVLTIADAWPIEVAAQEIIELDFEMPPVVIGSIRATVSGPEGYTLDQLRVMRPEANQIRNVILGADGVGYAEGLREARYVVAARGHTSGSKLAAFQIVHIPPGELPVNLSLSPAAKITGRVVAESGGVPPVDNLRVIAAWTDGQIDLDPLSTDEAVVQSDGSFTIDGLFATRAIRVTGLPEGWALAAIRHGRSDISTSALDLTSGTPADILITLARR